MLSTIDARYRGSSIPYTSVHRLRPRVLRQHVGHAPVGNLDRANGDSFLRHPGGPVDVALAHRHPVTDHRQPAAAPLGAERLRAALAKHRIQFLALVVGGAQDHVPAARVRQTHHEPMVFPRLAGRRVRRSRRQHEGLHRRQQRDADDGRRVFDAADDGAWGTRERRPDDDRHASVAARPDGPRVHDLGTEARQFVHRVVAHALQEAGAGRQPRVHDGHALDVGEDVHAARPEGGANRDARRVAAAAAQRRVVEGLGRDALATGDDRHDAGVHQCPEPSGVHAFDVRLDVAAVRDDPCLGGRQAPGRDPRALERLGHHGD